MNAQQVKDLGAQRYTVTGAQIVTILAAIVLTGGGIVAALSGQWATVNLRLTQTEAAAKDAGEAAQDVKERLTDIAADLRNISSRLVRVENKMDNLGSSQSARHPSASTPSFPPN